MNNTEIRWTEKTWNPASGCVKVSPGCKHCYAETIAENKRGTRAFPNGFDLTLRPHKMREPYAIKEPSLVFVNSMSDLFWEEIPDSYRDQVVDVIADTPQHEYQVLTKRHENMLRYSRRRKLPPNFWAGVSVENQEWADKRIPVLLQVEAEIRFLSAEPIVDHIDFRPFVTGRNNKIGGDGIQWAIFGGESGTHISRDDVRLKRGLVEKRDGAWMPRPDRMHWARDMRDACVENATAFFFKQWGGPRSTSGGKMLDDRTWEEWPRLPAKQTQPAGLTARRSGGQLGLAVVE